MAFPQVGRLRHLLGPRGRRVLNAGAWSLLAKAAAAANLFIAVPFVLKALGPVEFGAWATLVSLATFAGFLDFGLGNGTMNLIAAAHGRGASDEVAEVLREGRRTLTHIAAGLAVVVAVALPLLPWHRLLGLPAAYVASSRGAAAAVLFAIVLAVPLNLATRVQLGLGRGELAFRWQVAGQLLTLGLVIVLARLGGSLPILTAAAVGTPLLAAAANTVTLSRSTTVAGGVVRRRPDLVRRIRREGLLFFILQLAAALAFSADLPLISAIKGSAEAGTYAIVQRLFSVIPLSLSLIWAPLWPIYRQALAAGNHDWVVATLRRSLLLAIAFSAVVAVILASGFHIIVPLWVRHPLAISQVLLLGMATWMVIDAVGTALATFFNAASIMRYQVVVASVFAVTCLAIKAWAIGHFGITAVPWVTVATYLATSLLPTAILGPRLFATALAKEY